MITPAFEILNQKGTPMFNSDLTANRPTAGVVGRIFIATDSPYGIFRDNGTSWDTISTAGGGGVSGSGVATRVAFWDSTSSISSNANLYWDNTNSRLGINTATPGVPLDVHGTGTNATFNGTGTNNAFLVFQNAGTGRWQIGNVYSGASNYFRVFDVTNSTERLSIQNTGAFSFTGFGTITDTRTYSTGTIQSTTIDKQLTIPNAATISSSVTLSSALIGGQTTFQGSVTIPNTTTLNTSLISNSFNFTGAGTITMTQATGIRAASSNQVLSYFSGTASSTISHYAAHSIYGWFNSNTGSITPVITNAYQLLINNIDDYTHTFTFTNRWGIYQNGASDNNYFASKVLIGTNVVSTFLLDVSGTARMSAYSSSGLLTVTSPVDTGTTKMLVNASSVNGAALTLVSDTSGRGIRITDGTIIGAWDITGSVKLGSNNGYDLDLLSNGQRRLTINSLSGNILIGTNTDVASSLLTLSSTSKGFLTTRLTTAQLFAISSPANALEAYKTDGYQGKFQYIENEWLPIADGTELLWWNGNQGNSAIVSPMTTQASGTGAAVGFNTLNLVNTKTHSVSLATGTTTTGSAGIYTAQSTGMNNGTAGNKFCFRYVFVTPSALSNATDTYSITIGNGLLPPAQPSLNTFGFYYTHGTNAGAWTCFWNTIAGGSSTSGVTVAVNTQYTLEIEFILGTSIKYYINGSLVLTQSAGIPTALGAGYLSSASIVKSAGTTSVTGYAASLLARKLI